MILTVCLLTLLASCGSGDGQINEDTVNGDSGNVTAEPGPESVTPGTETEPSGDTEDHSEDTGTETDPPDNAETGENADGTDTGYAASEKIVFSTTQGAMVYNSSEPDKSAIIIDTDEKVTITMPTVNKTGDSEGGDECSFYGRNAAVLVMGGSDTMIIGGTVDTDAEGANAVFCYGGGGNAPGEASEGDGTTVTVTDTAITTAGNGSGGIMTTGGGTMNAYNLNVKTKGSSSAPIRTDRGGGTVNVEGGAYTSSGLGSPAIYSTAAVSVREASLSSEQSEGIVIEGRNSVSLEDCELVANNTNRNGNARFLDSVMIYQSMSGDAETGKAVFSMKGGSITSSSGHVFHVTNTEAEINLENVEIINEDESGVLISVCDDGWSGATNSAVLNAADQELKGAVLVGKGSSLEITLSGESSFEGFIGGDISDADGSKVSDEAGEVKVTLGEGCTWKLTADSYITKFEGRASDIKAGGFKVFVDGEELTGTGK